MFHSSTMFPKHILQKKNPKQTNNQRKIRSKQTKEAAKNNTDSGFTFYPSTFELLKSKKKNEMCSSLNNDPETWKSAKVIPIKQKPFTFPSSVYSVVANGKMNRATVSDMSSNSKSTEPGDKPSTEREPVETTTDSSTEQTETPRSVSISSIDTTYEIEEYPKITECKQGPNQDSTQLPDELSECKDITENMNSSGNSSTDNQCPEIQVVHFSDVELQEDLNLVKDTLQNFRNDLTKTQENHQLIPVQIEELKKRVQQLNDTLQKTVLKMSQIETAAKNDNIHIKDVASRVDTLVQKIHKPKPETTWFYATVMTEKLPLYTDYHQNLSEEHLEKFERVLLSSLTQRVGCNSYKKTKRLFEDGSVKELWVLFQGQNEVNFQHLSVFP